MQEFEPVVHSVTVTGPINKKEVVSIAVTVILIHKPSTSSLRDLCSVCPDIKTVKTKLTGVLT